MTRYAILVALLALCMVSPASAGVTRFPNGIVVGDINDSPTVTPGADDLYVKGTFEVDGAVTLDSTFDVDGSVTLNGDNTLGNASTDTQTLNGDTTISGALVAGNDGAPLILKNASATCFAVTTNGNPSNGDVIFTFTNGDAGTMTMIADDGADQFIFNKPIDVSDVELATLSARDGSLVGTLASSTGNIDLAAALDVTGVATFDGDVDLDATGGTSADPDFSVDGYTKLASLLEISAQTVAPVTASTAAGTIIYIGGSPNADQDTQYISDGGGGTEGFQANEPYMWNGSKWVPMFTGITP